MRTVALLASLVLITAILVDAFETILQPRRVTHRFRYARLYYRNTWALWRNLATLLPTGKSREAMLGVFGPLSLIGLFVTWVIGLLVGFALLHWSLRSPIVQHVELGFIEYLYLSGTTFFTLGYGDITPTAFPGRALAVIESGLGFGFLAVIISYLPVLYQAFSKRESTISLMDARAGSPPSAGQFLLRLARAGRIEKVDPFLAEWELWAAELLESHLSLPVLSYYRSQHDNQSWLAALTTILDSCAILITDVKRIDTYQPQLTFAMARHAAVDLSLVLKAPPRNHSVDRIASEQRDKLLKSLGNAGVELHERADADAKFAELRAIYEPFLNALAQRFMIKLPGLMADDDVADNWQRSAWMKRTPGIGSLPGATDDGDHF